MVNNEPKQQYIRLAAVRVRLTAYGIDIPILVCKDDPSSIAVSLSAKVVNTNTITLQIHI